MGDTLDSLTGGANPRLTFIIAIEGYPYLLTTGSASAAVTAWTGTDWTSALEGLEINWDQRQALDPWKAFPPGSSLDFKVVDCDGTDRFGIDVHRREGGTSAKLAADVGADDATISVLRTDDFASSGTLYLGPEAFTYSSKNDGTDVFTVSARGKWSPFEIEGGGGFGRPHQLLQVSDGVPPSATAATTVRTHPTEWQGKWMGVWIHTNRGGVLDTKEEAHLAFAGRIAAPVKDTSDGLTVVSCDDLRETLNNTVILKRQFRARVKEGIYLSALNYFACRTNRIVSSTSDQHDADHLVVVASGASGDNEINEGWYNGSEIEAAINTWLASEHSAGRSLFQLSYRFSTGTDDGLRASLRMTDPDNSDEVPRIVKLNANEDRVREALGWRLTPDGGLWVEDNYEPEITVYGPTAPIRVNAGWARYDSTSEIRIEVANGQYVDQTAFLNPTIQGAGFASGILRIGDDFFACDEPVVSNGEGTVNVRRVRELDQALNSTANKLMLTVEDTGDLNVSQVLMLEGSLQKLVMALFTSTGSQFFNSSLFDLLPDQCGAGIPWSLLTADFEDELLAAPDGGVPMTITVEEPTRLTDLLDASFQLRNIAPIWRQGRLALKGWATPTSEATLTFTADDKAAPIEQAAADSQRAVAEYTDKWWRNVVKVRFNRSIFGNDYRDTMNLIGVEAGGGDRPATINARNAVRGSGFVAGEDINSLISTYVGGLTFLTRPVLIARVPVNHSMFETLTPGEVMLFTDPHMRDPSTGERGVTAKPALVVGHSHNWGGPTIGAGGAGVVQEAHGEVDLMLFPQMSISAYAPTADVDYTGINGGYDAGTSTLSCISHSYTDAGASAVDASYFTALDQVTICEIDPSDPAAPTTWNRVVQSQTGDTITLTVALSSPAWDSAKRYRIYSRNYSTAVTSQRTKVYQADDADGLVADSREPYGYGHGVQATTATSALSGTETGRRHTAATYGDGAPLTTGAAWDSAINLNNLVNYLTAPQQPMMYSEPSTFKGASGTWELVRASWRHIGVGRLNPSITRKLWVAPRFKSGDGSSASVRVRLCRHQPRSADPTAPSLTDVVPDGPYTEVTFTSSSTSYVVPTADDLDIGHLKLDDGLLGGGGFLLIELTEHAVYDGLEECWVGPLVTP